MKYTLTIESDSAEDIRGVTEKLTGRVAETTDTSDTTETIETTETTETIDTTDTTDVRSDQTDNIGMPYNPSIHSTPPSFKADGSWKVKKGQADNAKAAIAAFKAGGGNVDAPNVEEDEVQGMPVVTETKGMPGVPATEPVSLDTVMTKVTDLMANNGLTGEKANEFYVKATGIEDPTKHYPEFTVNETARAALYADLLAFEAG